MPHSIASLLRDVRITRPIYVLAYVAPVCILIPLCMMAMSGKLLMLGQAPFLIMAFGLVYVIAFGDALSTGRYRDIGQSGRPYKILRPVVAVLLLGAYVLQIMLPTHMAMAGDMDMLFTLMAMDIGGFHLLPIPAALLILAGSGIALNMLYLSLMPSGAGLGMGGGSTPHPEMPVPGLTGGKAKERPAGADKLSEIIEREAAAYRDRAATASAAVRPTGPGGFGKRRS